MNSIQVEARYRNKGGNWKDSDDQFNRFFRFDHGGGKVVGIGNAAGFRAKGRAGSGASKSIVDCAFCVLVTNLGEREWPDSLDRETGLFTYYGDNRKPGHTIEDTPLGGNRLLASAFGKVHQGKRSAVPPFLCFEKVATSSGTYMRFLGLACPGAEGLSATEDLVGVWRMTKGERFQNYRAVFSILEVDSVPKSWLQDLVSGSSPADSEHCPKAWRHWVQTGKYQNLVCEPQKVPRSKADQMGANPEEHDVLNRVYNELTPREFEFAAMELTRMLDRSFVDLVVTRPSRDGGRDVVGRYIVGHDKHRVGLTVAIEAKRWKPGSAVGVRQMMRLISRLKHRDLGVFMTTGFFETQVQQELIDDEHPVLLVSGGDIARLLIKNDRASPKQFAAWVTSIKSAAGTLGAGSELALAA
ncbi:restriction endonuclease [Ramlibacter sp.]|uniref:restriction endonuclease n=1 Tax=Ramlibacter sp. TaxID=1917967 RepID=UPI002D3F1F32|nr:restriction endonuclease [Ramlibacter sp.]HYD77549.1 restriction endonuclease [Ramlibacter sp.]